MPGIMTFLPYVLTIAILVLLHVIDTRDRRQSFARLRSDTGQPKHPDDSKSATEPVKVR